MGLVRFPPAIYNRVSASRLGLTDGAGSRRRLEGPSDAACVPHVLVVTALASYIGAASMSSSVVHVSAAMALPLVLLLAIDGIVSRWRKGTPGAGRAELRTLAAHIPTEVRSYR